jgi:predicted nucleotide-binding protein
MSAVELLEIAEHLAAGRKHFEDTCAPVLRRVADAAGQLARAWSGSNLGYHADVYYAGLMPRPPGAQFSSEWGIGDHWPIQATLGNWQEFSSEDIRDEIYRRAGNPDLSSIRTESTELEELVNDAKATMLSAITISMDGRDDKFLAELREKAAKLKIHPPGDFARALLPTGQLFSRDSLAMTQGLRLAPHQVVVAELTAIKQSATCAHELARLAAQAGAHLNRLERHTGDGVKGGSRVFIGHGHSTDWRLLRDFIRDRVGLQFEEFNRVSPAGISNVARLRQMLDSASFAFLVLTAEDEHSDGKQHARMNVVHEVGLFQGRLGFERSIVLLEEDCEEFSNIDGLGQIRFPKGNIAAAFEQIREVLEREGLIRAPN